MGNFFAALFRAFTSGWEREHEDPEIHFIPLTPPVPSPTPIQPVPAPEPTPVLDWSTQKGAYHATRVVCDQMGLTFAEKELICACIMQESQFLNSARCENKDKAGRVWSTDFGLVQCNDWFHIGKGKEFPSVKYLLDHPEEQVKWMIRAYNAGHLSWWVSYSSGAYRQWLKPNSAMRQLAK